MFLLARCPHCRRSKITIKHPSKDKRRIRTHKEREAGRPLTELAFMARCPGSLSVVALDETHSL